LDIIQRKSNGLEHSRSQYENDFLGRTVWKGLLMQMQQSRKWMARSSWKFGIMIAI